MGLQQKGFGCRLDRCHKTGLHVPAAQLQHTGVLPNGEIKTLPGNKKLQQVTRKKKMRQNGFLESRWLKV